VSLVLYVGHLGFYYDDYSILERMRASDDRSLLGLYHSVSAGISPRPVQATTFVLLYRLFGVDPLGYHVVNGFLLVAVAALLYLVLRELRLPRLVCVAVPLVYSTLPHYATDRFWFAAFQINLSTAFYLLSLYAGLRAIRSSSLAVAVWLSIAVVAVAASLLAYEVVYPLFALSVGLIWWAGRRLPDGEINRRAVLWTAGAVAASVVATGLSRLAVFAEEGSRTGHFIGFEDSVIHHVAYLVSGSIRLNLGTYFVAFPYVLWWIVRHEFSLANAAIAGITGLFALAYLWHVGRQSGATFRSSTVWRATVGVGLVAFVLGYAIFLTNQGILFRSAGIDNRVNAGAALGVAGVLVGAIGWLVGRLEWRWRPAAFAVTVGCAVAGGVFVITTLSSFWTKAARQQRAIVTAITREAGPVAPSTTIILDGSCPETGPAVVFADQWDLRAALQIRYQDPSLEADVASETMRATPDGLSIQMTFLDRVFTRTYPYGRRLFVYDHIRGRLYRLVDRTEAIRYVAHSRPSFRCPPQRSFAWGFDPSHRWTFL
jgi:hypothetical protein